MWCTQYYTQLYDTFGEFSGLYKKTIFIKEKEEKKLFIRSCVISITLGLKIYGQRYLVLFEWLQGAWEFFDIQLAAGMKKNTRVLCIQEYVTRRKRALILCCGALFSKKKWAAHPYGWRCKKIKNIINNNNNNK